MSIGQYKKYSIWVWVKDKNSFEDENFLKEKEDENAEIQRETEWFQNQHFYIEITKQLKTKTIKIIVYNITVINYILKVSGPFQGGGGGV